MSDLTQIIGGGFNAEEIEDAPEFSELEAGIYYAEVEKAECVFEEDNGQKTGNVFVEIQYNVFRTESGEDVKGKVWDKFAMTHTSEKRQKWGRIFWKGFVEAMFGKGNIVTETDQYIGQTIKIEVEYTPNKNNPDKPYKNVKNRWPADSDTKTKEQPAEPAPAVEKPAASAPAKKPWEK